MVYILYYIFVVNCGIKNQFAKNMVTLLLLLGIQ